MAIKLGELTCAGTARRVASGDLSAAELIEATLDAITAQDENLGAFLAVYGKQARQRAQQIDSDADLRRQPLAGVPIAVKDNLCVADCQTTAGSRILEPFSPPFTATVIERLESAGAVLIGKTNLDEFAMGSSTENSAFRRTTNPWDISRVPGGSSGGSAAAVASGVVAGALGSDTGGSIRQPAAFCGVVGLKPTYGRVSRYGLIAFASSLDQIGPLTRTVEDAALILSVVAGDDSKDSTTLPDPVPAFQNDLESDASGLKIGVPEAWLGTGVDPNIKREVTAVLAELEAAGAQLRPIELPHEEFAVATYYVIATAEASSNLARYDGVRYGFRAESNDLADMYANTRSGGFGNEVKRRILLGTFVLSAGYYDAYYGRAQCVRTLLCKDFNQAFADVDILVGPTTPSTAFAIGEKADNPLEMYLSDVFTVTANLAGLPGISVPCGQDDAGLPVGLQIIGPALGEAKILKAARLIEQLRGPFGPAPIV
ncbi:MAG TPA: Asp-tRNA(Asn)/Glu-tRNA(Gln) amidotransferase subunit GatA [Acidobacteriota bacterium]|jgi:aspartyl-tRNA(Asn)/glutamyl-tRNA(Gln) amidotransferase subunit A|nr:Asp-tRNA(Asn)/Glu-tRNA(Gln) amidotransferase subunit GatA [Acidobacteriota bacterium]